MSETRCAKCQKPIKSVWQCFRQYSEKTSIHGVRYLGEENRPIWEKIFWIIIFIFSIYWCITIILQVYYKWRDSPVLVAFNERETYLSQIPFPSVTICPEIKSNGDIFRFDNAVMKLENNNLTEQEIKYFTAVSHVCEFDTDYSSIPDEEFESNDIESTLIELAEKTIAICKFREHVEDCDEILKPIITDDGVCYNFNGVHLTDLYRENYLPRPIPSEYRNKKLTWNRFYGYDSGNVSYPERAVAGTMGLSLDLTIKKSSKDSMCNLGSNGFKVLIDVPDNIPQISDDYYFVPSGELVIGSVKPTTLMTPQYLQKYPIEKRKCYFDNERYLKYFKKYTKQNCKLECAVNLTLLECGCLPFSMPRPQNIPLCKFKDMDCYENVTTNLHIKNFERGKYTGDATGCDCLPACNSIQYQVEISQTKYSNEAMLQFMKEDLKEFFEIFEILNISIPELTKYQHLFYHPEKYEYTKIVIIFHEKEFLGSKRIELYGIADLLSNWGGTLGLFMGISALSFIEIIYHSTIRVFSNKWIQRKKRHTLNIQEEQEMLKIQHKD